MSIAPVKFWPTAHFAPSIGFWDSATLLDGPGTRVLLNGQAYLSPPLLGYGWSRWALYTTLNQAAAGPSTQVWIEALDPLSDQPFPLSIPASTNPFLRTASATLTGTPVLGTGADKPVRLTHGPAVNTYLGYWAVRIGWWADGADLTIQEARLFGMVT